ncbi:guanylate kinase isoform X2 [Bombus pascuorum]|nr:guanylate kinase isoform X2 [Bombus pascuorum]XP_060827003.1 guanylate kinase isoform X2 [Bombus pascuorum]XP_060827004.1 guanylate kinase isoform X2 [Bombus pascuorum]XP_060827005.1 guanylate kinase isoform X2 [Bombus pascuorum]XP_060827006.1 guanylate kinase isoform X2 [Bombus pascuorum]
MFHKGSRSLVLCGPSGSGKSTLLKKLFEEFPDTFGYSVSHTTRSPRPGEEDGKHYHFTTKDKMQTQIEQDEFLETATFSGNMYGTSKRAVEEVHKAGKICVLDLEMQGVKQIKQSSLDPLYIFIKAPSIEELEKRLRARKTETEDALQRRLSIARLEIEYGEKPGNFDIVIENDNVSKAYEKLRDFLMSNLKQGDAGR